MFVELEGSYGFYKKLLFAITGAYDWAKTSLKLHEKDKRKYLYTREKLEKGQTHDDLWNAAQVSLFCKFLLNNFIKTITS